MTLFSDMDHAHLLTDPTLVIQGADGGSQIFLPYRLGMLQQPMLRRDAQGVLRPLQPTINGVLTHPGATMNGHQIKKMPPPNTGLQMRISSSGGMRPPMTPVSNLQSNGGSSSPAPHQMSPPQTLRVPVVQHSLPMSGISRTAISLPQVDVHKSADIIAPLAIPNGIALATLPQPDINGSGNVEVAAANSSPPRPKPQNLTTPQSQSQHLGTAIPMNGYHLTPLAAAYSHSQSPPQLTNISNGGGLSQQQMRDLKSAFAIANIPAPELGSLQNASRVISGPYLHLGPNGNMNGIQLLPGTNIGNLKLSPANATARQMQWGTMATANGTGSPIMQMQQIPMRPGSAVNGNHLMDAQLAVNGGNALSSSGLGMLVNGQPHSISPLMRHSPSPLPNISHSQSPTRIPMTPNMAIIGSPPSLQHQQPPQTQSIGSTLNGFKI